MPPGLKATGQKSLKQPSELCRCGMHEVQALMRLDPAFYHRANFLQVYVPAPLGKIMGVANLVAKLRSLAAHITYFSPLPVHS